MIKYIEAPDFHYDPKWHEVSVKCGQAVKKAAIENKVDFIVLPGDLYNKPLYATDSGVNGLIEIVKSWLEVCPVVAIEGTPSHDGKGCYGVLEGIGLQLLKPGEAYFYHKIRGIINVKKYSHLYSEGPEAILFGIPELNKNNIMDKLNVSAEQANTEVIKYFNQYIENFVAPMRLKYKDIPAIGLLHGIISDSAKENTNDIIIKSSDIIIHTEDLEKANIDRWSLGHLHKPWESEKIFAGYAGYSGIDDRPWCNLNFVPGMNLIEINYNPRDPGKEYHGFWTKINRIPYGTPERIKITKPFDNYISDIAYWLTTEDTEYRFPENQVHPWSRITIEKIRKESQRISKEQAENIKTLSDLFKIIDPKVSKSVIKKVDTLESKNKSLSLEQRNIKMDYFKSEGSVFWGGKTIEIEFDKIFQPGLNGIMADENGAGKSAMLGLGCHPFPVCIGKDTKSGRQSALKDFFDKPESIIVKELFVNKEKHKHVMTIKGAHTNNPKLECYMYIDGESILDKATWDDMFTKCEELYGRFSDYLYTTFYVQPQQSIKYESSLMLANMTNIRDLVQSISGIDRESEKQESLKNIKTLKDQIIEKESWLKGAEEFTIDIKEVQKIIDISNEKLLEKDILLNDSEQAGQRLKSEVAELREQKLENDIEMSRETQNKDAIDAIKVAIDFKLNQTKQLKESAKNIPELRKAISDLEKNINISNKNQELKNIYDMTVISYNKELYKKQNEVTDRNNKFINEYDALCSKYRNIKSELEGVITGSKFIIENEKKACVNCGYVDPAAAKIVAENIERIKNCSVDLKDLIIPIKPKLEIVPDSLNGGLSKQPGYLKPLEVSGDINKLRTELEEGLAATTTIKNIEASLIEDNKELKECEFKRFDINPYIDKKLFAAEDTLEKERELYGNLKSDRMVLVTTIKEKYDIIKQALETKDQIKDTKKILISSKNDLSDWEYINIQLRPDKIPALELSLIIETIDEEATKNIKPYYEERFSFETQTQKAGKKKIVDDFDIIIHDSESGKDKSFLEYSPGQKAFFNDAYVKALILIRNNKAKINYNPVISDEADSPIHPDYISVFYEMQEKYYKDKSTMVLVVSHTPVAHKFIQNPVELKEMLYEK